ncbi:MAG: MmgE/PrpD family protein [Desulfofustis sp.]
MSTDNTGITRNVAHLCYEFNLDSLGEETVDRCRYLTLDFLGCAIRGSISESTQPVLRIAEARVPAEMAVPIIGTASHSEATFAALAIGAAAHSLELDDVVNSASLHPAVAVMPAALAAGYAAECSGSEFLSAIVCGYELMVKLGIALDPAAHYRRGFHPTGTCGTFGAAVAAGKIMRLDEKSLLSAIGIAGSQAAGSLEFLADGSFTKRFHAGWAAHSGMIAAGLAAEGFSGPATILEGSHGFLQGYSEKMQPQVILENWGMPWEVMNTSIKPHACCRYKQGPIDCILSLVEEYELSAAEIEAVEIGILDAGFALVAEPEEQKRAPQSVVDAQFSMPFGAALAIHRKNASLDRYCMEEIHNPEIIQLMKRVRCVRDPELDRKFPRKWPASVTITTKRGRVLKRHLDYPKGDPENPLSWDELIEKFKTLASEVLRLERCEEIVQLVRRLDDLRDIRELFALLQKR